MFGPRLQIWLASLLMGSISAVLSGLVPEVLLVEERGLLSQTAAGNRAHLTQDGSNTMDQTNKTEGKHVLIQ